MKPLRLLLLLASFVALSGCQPGEVLGKVKGTVTFEGRPASPALIAFSNPAKGVHMLAEVQADGTYQVRMAKGLGLPLGTYQISISPPLPDVPMGRLQAPLPKSGKVEYIPDRYRKAETSGLTLDVKAGENAYNVEMVP